MRLGVPYQGSKNAIARQIVSILPSGKRFVDLFAGGCAMTHAAILSGKYERFVANDLHGFGVRLFRDAIAGKCKGAWRRWVSRDEFKAKRDYDPLISICWSFGSNMSTYLYSEEIEEQKKQSHNAYIHALDNDTIYIPYGAFRKQNTEIEFVDELENLERLQSIENNQALERLQALESDYKEVPIESGDVVYCDPPYNTSTEQYRHMKRSGLDFNHDSFWEWVRSRDFPVFVSEYTAPDDFVPIWRKGKMRLMNQNGADGKAVEKVFVAERWAREYQSDLFPDF